MATNTKSKPIVTFNKTGNHKSPGVNACVWHACVWHSHITDEWKWEASVGDISFATGRADTREQAERAAARTIPALARRALRTAAKELATATARHKDLSKALAAWVN